MREIPLTIHGGTIPIGYTVQKQQVILGVLVGIPKKVTVSKWIPQMIIDGEGHRARILQHVHCAINHRRFVMMDIG